MDTIRKRFLRKRPSRESLLSDFETLSQLKNFQRIWMLDITFLVGSFVLIPIGILNYLEGSYVAALVEGIFILICLIGLFLNQRGATTIASVIALIIFYIAAISALIEGFGLRDPSVVAFPVIIIFASLAFGKYFAMIASGLSIFVVAVLYHFLYLDTEGLLSLVNSKIPVTFGEFITMSIILMFVGILQYAVMDFWERNMAWVQASSSKIHEANEHILGGWARALEYRDKETEGHSQRVVEFSLAFAKKIGILEEKKLDIIRRGAMLHDIGKMGIPDRILLKEGPLSDEEWIEIKKHPLIAQELLGELIIEESVMDIPLYHHERWDGSGYPFGLSGAEIPLTARLFSIIDNWDALSSDRPYSAAWKREDIENNLREEKGAKFDPNLVEPFLELMAERY